MGGRPAVALTPPTIARRRHMNSVVIHRPRERAREQILFSQSSHLVSDGDYLKTRQQRFHLRPQLQVHGLAQFFHSQF